MKKVVFCCVRVSACLQVKEGDGMTLQQATLLDYVKTYEAKDRGRGYELGEIVWLKAPGVRSHQCVEFILT